MRGPESYNAFICPVYMYALILKNVQMENSPLKTILCGDLGDSFGDSGDFWKKAEF